MSTNDMVTEISALTEQVAKLTAAINATKSIGNPTVGEPRAVQREGSTTHQPTLYRGDKLVSTHAGYSIVTDPHMGECLVTS